MRHHEGGGDDAMERHEREMHGDRDMEGAHHGKPMGPPGGRMGHDGGEEMIHELAALGVHLYPPPMLINRAKELGLTPDQVNKIRQEMLTTHSKAIDLHAKVEHSKLEVEKLMTAEKVDEKAVGAQIDEAAKAEAEMHKLHVGTLLHVRAILTADQLKKLEEMKPEHHMPDHMRPEHGGGQHAEHHD
jgi:Spy/CpxP family protein refolding chaperone